MSNLISRRELLKRAGAVSAAAVVPSSSHQPFENLLAGAQTAARPQPFEHLTAMESDVLEAIVARLIPTDATGPGAKEARAAHYIDRALGGALASSRSAYAAGLAAVDRIAQTSRGKAFKDLAPEEQDAILTDVEAGNVPAFAGAGAFFALVRAHTIQGTFSDPYYGGNAGFVGWDLIGYPGVRTVVTADDQRLGAAVPANHKSAYDYEMFTKATASVAPSRGMNHGE
jgi:gluconate 2-dehydrogenase gamma chain